MKRLKVVRLQRDHHGRAAWGVDADVAAPPASENRRLGVEQQTRPRPIKHAGRSAPACSVELQQGSRVGQG